jgi:hypothetical protein
VHALRVGIVDTTDTDDYEVSTPSITSSGSALELAWAGVKNQPRAYRVKTSTAPMKVHGWASGTDHGLTTNPGSDYCGCFKSIPVSVLGEIWIGVGVDGSAKFREFRWSL